MEPNVEQVLNEYLEKYKDIKFPFLEHLDYFKGDDGEITSHSIAEQQSKLSGESIIKTTIIGKITISGANNNNPEYNKGSCPWKNSFESGDMLKNLKHPCDTGIVNEDGSINIDILTNFVKLNFEYDNKTKTFIMRKSKMFDHLKLCKERDAQLKKGVTFYLPSFETVAQGEWSSFYGVYYDRDFNGEKAVTLNTFLQFYFESNVLNQRALSGELSL